MDWTEKDERDFVELGKRRLKAKKGHAGYDIGIDLSIGEEGERMLVRAFGNCEVKRIFEASRWGQVFVEHSNYGRASGIETSTADFWFFVLDGPEYDGEVVIGIKTQRLKELVYKMPESIPVGQNKASLGTRPWISELIMPRRRVPKRAYDSGF